MTRIAAVAGTGFTVSLFVAGLAYDDEALEGAAKVGILAGSLLAALGGNALLASARPSSPEHDRDEVLRELAPTAAYEAAEAGAR